MSGIILKMASGMVRNISTAYQVATPIFHGPFDLLLYLIEKSQLDITKLSLSTVTNQYLEYLQYLEENQPEEISSFLVIAAKLVQIKSEVLLPRQPLRPEEDQEDSAEDMARQLLEYRKIRNAAIFLENLQKGSRHTFLRLAAPLKLEGSVKLDDISIDDFLDQAANVLKLNQPREIVDSIKTPKINIRDKISLVTRNIKLNKTIKFHSLFTKDISFLEIVITFLAILELIKQKIIFVEQTALFSEMIINPTEEFSEDIAFELEFEE